MTGTAQDITEIKQAQAALQQANEQLHLLSRRLFEVQEDERRHLARELHDQIGQALTAAKISLQSARRLKERNAIRRRLGDGLAIVEGLLQQVRQLSLELRPPLLDDLGLMPALRCYLDQQAQTGGLHIEFFADPELRRVEAAIQTACFRVAQEALTNAVRHARAHRVSVDECPANAPLEGRGSLAEPGSRLAEPGTGAFCERPAGVLLPASGRPRRRLVRPGRVALRRATQRATPKPWAMNS
jgi:glucose-6-phosphate-specific signal transduction histidine kinase